MKAGAIGQVMTSKRVTDLEEDEGFNREARCNA